MEGSEGRGKAPLPKLERPSMAETFKALAATDIDRNGNAVAYYAAIITGRSVGGDHARYYISGICEGNREGFATWQEAARYVNATWPAMPIGAA